MCNRTPLRIFSFLLIVSVLLVSSCDNRSIMFRSKRNYPYKDPSEIPQEREYKIGLNDRVQINVTPNSGAILLENALGQIGGSSTLIVVVEFDGTVKLPVLGRVLLKELTTREAELLLEERYKQVFIDPFVNLTILNKRVILFLGEGGSARVVTLTNQNTTLTEVLAFSGGISANGKAHRIKLIRGDPKKPEVYLIDLSSIDGMTRGDVVLQGNDIVYVEPRNDVILNFSARVSAYTFLVSLILFYVSLVK